MGPHQKTEYGWEIYPKGLYRVLKRVGRLGKPSSSPKTASPTPTTISARGTWSRTCDRRTGRIADGVDLRGYIHWSLMDNFEWSEGFTKRFGLAEVDLATQRRTLRPSAEVYSQIARSNSISPGPVHPRERRTRVIPRYGIREE